MPTEFTLHTICLQVKKQTENSTSTPPPTLKTKLIGKNLTSHTQKSATDDLHAPQENNFLKAFIHTN
jgi:hypothetical protein